MRLGPWWLKSQCCVRQPVRTSERQNVVVVVVVPSGVVPSDVVVPSVVVPSVVVPSDAIGKGKKVQVVQSDAQKMSVQVDLDFTKETLSKTVLDIFRNGLQGNPDQSGSKQTYEECLRTLSQGKKLQYGAANFLLLGIVRSLGIGNCSPDDEFLPGERQDDKDLGKDPTLSQIMADTRSQKKKTDMTQDQDDTIHMDQEREHPARG